VVISGTNSDDELELEAVEELEVVELEVEEVVELELEVEEVVELAVEVLAVVEVVVEELGAELVVVEVVVELALLDSELEGATTPQAASTSTKNESNAVFFICKIIPPN
jgi:hypothetical protein